MKTEVLNPERTETKVKTGMNLEATFEELYHTINEAHLKALKAHAAKKNEGAAAVVMQMANNLERAREQAAILAAYERTISPDRIPKGGNP